MFPFEPKVKQQFKLKPKTKTKKRCKEIGGRGHINA